MKNNINNTNQAFVNTNVRAAYSVKVRIYRGIYGAHVNEQAEYVLNVKFNYKGEFEEAKACITPAGMLINHKVKGKDGKEYNVLKWYVYGTIMNDGECTVDVSEIKDEGKTETGWHNYSVTLFKTFTNNEVFAYKITWGVFEKQSKKQQTQKQTEELKDIETIEE